MFITLVVPSDVTFLSIGHTQVTQIH